MTTISAGGALLTGTARKVRGAFTRSGAHHAWISPGKVIAARVATTKSRSKILIISSRETPKTPQGPLRRGQKDENEPHPGNTPKPDIAHLNEDRWHLPLQRFKDTISESQFFILRRINGEENPARLFESTRRRSQ